MAVVDLLLENGRLADLDYDGDELDLEDIDGWEGEEPLGLLLLCIYCCCCEEGWEVGFLVSL